MNIAADGALAILAVLAAFWLADPVRPWPHPLALPLASAAAIWLIGIPFGLSRLHWRFTSLRDLALVGGASVLTALLLTLLLIGAGLKLPSASFPACLALCLIVARTTPRLLYRLARLSAKKSMQTSCVNRRRRGPHPILAQLIDSHKRIGV